MPVELADGDVQVFSPSGDGSFSVHWEGARVGRVELLVDGADADLIWAVVPEYAGVGVIERALRLVVGWGETDCGVHRTEARVEREDYDRVRTALRAGLLKEGVLRESASPGGRADVVVLARIVGDPAPDSRAGFIGMLNSTLPRKRQIAQGLVRNASGQVMVCELVYKREWDLPGGVVDPGESPASCLEREIREETGMSLTAGALLAVDWLPPWRGWDDATLLLFDLGTIGDDALASATLQPREIRALHWVDAGEAAEHLAPYTARLLARVLGGEPTSYLENSDPREIP